MCGIVGLISATPVEAQAFRRLVDRIRHRGPDDSGIWQDHEAGVHFGHRRLAIVDLSTQGRQPMLSSDGRLVIVLNGEIYNHLTLRAELESEWSGTEGAHSWRGHSDTETLIECIARWGLRRALEKSVGMFAFALWDRRERVLHFVRDRFGEKPLYYGWAGRTLLFGSELKALRVHPDFDNPIARRSLVLLAARGYIPSPHSIHERVYKVPPATILSVRLHAAATPLAEAPDPEAAPPGWRAEVYWNYRDVVTGGLDHPFPTEGEALVAMGAALADAIGGQAVADVPVGAFLSGGIDSSTVVALYQKYASSRVRTFSIGFEESGFNEAPHAREIAAHLGTDHHERTVTVSETRDVIPRLPEIYDEPFADSSQIPTCILAAFAREQVTVALSGDGGDELFGGYNRYLGTARVWSRIKRFPRPLRALGGTMLGQVPGSAWNQAARLLHGERPPHFGSKLRRALRSISTARELEGLMAGFLDDWGEFGSPVLGENDQTAFQHPLGAGGAAGDAVRMMYADTMTYLPDDILCKVDRAAMAVSLETRVPFLDHRVAEVAAKIPIEMKIQGGSGKRILRKLLYAEIPPLLFARPKAGFAVPVGVWLRGALRPWAEDLLSPALLARDGFFDTKRVRSIWQAHLDEKIDATSAIWSILMFQAWRSAFRA